MATSDKDTGRGDAGRDSHQSAEQAGEAEGSPLAARTAGPGTIPVRSIRHESWLGIFVVILLVFALGFLVYQKVERHERQLTQAAIAPREVDAVPAADRQPIAAAATDAAPADFGSIAEMTTSDPLAVPTAAEPSPFSEAAEPAAEASPEPAADSAPVFAFSEPADEPAVAAPPVSGIPVAELTAEPGNGVPAESLIDLPAQSGAEPAADVPELLVLNGDDTPALAAAPLSEAETPAAADSDTGNPFDAPESLPSADSAQSPPEITAESGGTSMNFPDASPLLLAAADPEPGEPTQGTPRTEAEKVDFAAPGQPGDVAASESADSPTAPQLPDFAFSPDAAALPAEGAESAEPPPLLALAEPQFSPAGTSQLGSVPPSEAFNAITRPGGGDSGGSRRGQPGSTGADRDGRFSLAAFNTGNTSVQPGTDDGDKHPSVIVRSGENYSKISRRVYGTTRYFSALAVFNQHRIPNPDAMRPGMIVLTPDAGLLQERYPQLFPDLRKKAEEPAGFLLQDDGSPAYRVGARETLSEISERFLGRSTRWVEIFQLNRSVLSDPNILKPGLVLALPDDATEVQLVP